MDKANSAIIYELNCEDCEPKQQFKELKDDNTPSLPA